MSLSLIRTVITAGNGRSRFSLREHNSLPVGLGSDGSDYPHNGCVWHIVRRWHIQLNRLSSPPHDDVKPLLSAAGSLKRSKGRVPVREAMARHGKLSFLMRRLSKVGDSSQERQNRREFQEDFFRFSWEKKRRWRDLS